MRIGLSGFTFSHENKGCEALTYSVLELISKLYDNQEIEIVCFSDFKGLGNVPKEFNQFKYIYCPLKFKDVSFKVFRMIRSCDVILDVTFGDGFSDIYFTKSVYRKAIIKIIMGMSRSKYILMPQTYGPFKDKKLEKLAGLAIRKANVVFARDEMSRVYAEKISKRKVETFTDLAFLLPFDKEEKREESNDFGLNVSGLLYKGGFSGENQFGLTLDYKKFCYDTIDYLLENTAFKIHLIPHVTVSSDPHRSVRDSDSEGCRKVKEMYSDNDRVILAPDFSDPIEVKNYIARMRFFAGARMHGTIAAFSAGTITIPIAYSRKFKGLYDRLGYPYVLDICQTTQDQALDIIIQWISEPSGLIQSRNKAMAIVDEDIMQFKKKMKRIIDKK